MIGCGLFLLQILFTGSSSSSSMLFRFRRITTHDKYHNKLISDGCTVNLFR